MNIAVRALWLLVALSTFIFLMTQLVVPAWTRRPFWPAFRSRKKKAAEEALAEANEKRDVTEIEVEIIKVEKEIEELRQEASGPFVRPECIYKYCPHPEHCKDRCTYPSK